MSAAEEIEPTLEELISESCRLKNEHEIAKAKATELYKEREEVNALIFNKLEEQGTSTCSTDAGRATISTSLKPKYTDRRAAFEFIKENDAIELLPNTISSPAYKEYVDAGIDIPGVEAYEKRDVRVYRKR